MFRSGVQPRKLWDEARVIEGFARQLQIFRWENRLVCHENSTESWWATLDNLADGDDARVFWESSFQNQNIARIIAVRRGFADTRSHGGALLHIEPQWFDVLITADNSGWARMEEESQWREFAAIAPNRLSRPGAWRPSIWSRRFQLGFGQRSLDNLRLGLFAQLLREMPAPIREIAEDGHFALLVRLVSAAFAQGWITKRPRLMTLPEFWIEALSEFSPHRLPRGLSQNLKISAPVKINLVTWKMSSHPATLRWQSALGFLYVEFWTHFDSAHEQLEAKLELRDWLRQFFDADEVNRWIK